MMNMNDTPPLLPLIDLARYVDTSADQLAAQLADQVLLNDLGLPSIDRANARALIAEHQAAKAAAAEAKKRNQAALSASVAAQTGALHRRVAALAARDRQLRANGDDLSSFEKMAVGESDHRGRAGRQLEDLFLAARLGVDGVGGRYSDAPKEG